METHLPSFIGVVDQIKQKINDAMYNLPLVSYGHT